MDVGNITGDDAQALKELTLQLYEHIYRHYEELGGYQDMKPLLEGAMELPLDKYRMKIDELEEAKAEADAKVAEADAKAAKEQEARVKAEKEIEKLRKELEELRK